MHRYVIFFHVIINNILSGYCLKQACKLTTAKQR